MRTHRIAVIAGDGIGQEVTPAALVCLRALGERHGFALDTTDFDWGSEYYHRHGSMMPADGIQQLSTYDAIYLGAVGDPAIADTETLWGLLIPIRREFNQYVNLRPVRTLAGVPARVTSSADIDLLIVRENVEGEYSSVGGRIYQGRDGEAAIQQSVFTRAGIERVARYAADLSMARSRRITSATKSNGIVYTMPFWDEVVAEVVAHYPDLELDAVLIDALSAALVMEPSSFDVIVASNLFGDILSDLAGAIAGSIGVAPSANLNPEREYPSMFEPVHGSAPDIAGQGIANPVGQMWAGAMMLDHLGEAEAATEMIAAFEACLSSGTRTRDLGGTASTNEFTTAVLNQVNKLGIGERSTAVPGRPTSN